MKKLALVLLAIGSFLSGCVGYDGPSERGSYRGERDRDRDGDGVRNSEDRRPDDPRRY